VVFVAIFVKLALQTNQKIGLKSLQWVLLQLICTVGKEKNIYVI
jgi:hypothetical protein